MGHDEFDELAISLGRILEPEPPFIVRQHKGLPHHTMRLFDGNTSFIHHHALKRFLTPTYQGGQRCENNHGRAKDKRHGPSKVPALLAVWGTDCVTTPSQLRQAERGYCAGKFGCALYLVGTPYNHVL